MKLHWWLGCVVLAPWAVLVARGQEEPVREAAVAQESASVEAVYDEEQVLWSLGEQTWEFGDVATAYLPAKGVYHPATREAVWTFQLVKDLIPGEVGWHSAIAGTPFKLAFLDADRTLVAAEARVKMTMITGKLGDAVRVRFRLPDEATLSKAALIRVERRTEIGF